MGMFDEIKCKYPLPDPEVQDKTFQTKDLECAMEWYTITEDGKLIFHDSTWEEVPEEERPYWGKPEWVTNPIVRIIGAIKQIDVKDVFMEDFTGTLRMYTIKDEIFYEYKVFFYRGQVGNIIRVFLEKGM